MFLFNLAVNIFNFSNLDEVIFFVQETEKKIVLVCPISTGILTWIIHYHYKITCENDQFARIAMASLNLLQKMCRSEWN